MTHEAGRGSEEFAARLVAILKDAMLALMGSLGHRTGLFDVMTALPSSTSLHIAEVAGLEDATSVSGRGLELSATSGAGATSRSP